MKMTSEFDLYSRAEKRRATARRVSLAMVLGLLAISLVLFAAPVLASEGEPPNAASVPEAGVSTCASRSNALARFHRAKPVDDPVNGAWSLAEAEFYVAQYGVADLPGTTRCEALARFHRTKPVDDPLNGAWTLPEVQIYLAKYGAEPAACTTWSEALARFHRTKPIADPVNGAWSLAEAEFYVTKYGAEDAGFTTLEENAQVSLCDAGTNSVRP